MRNTKISTAHPALSQGMVGGFHSYTSPLIGARHLNLLVCFLILSWEAAKLCQQFIQSCCKQLVVHGRDLPVILVACSIILFSNLILAGYASARDYIEGQWDWDKGTSKTLTLRGYPTSYPTEVITIRHTRYPRNYWIKTYENGVKIQDENGAGREVGPTKFGDWLYSPTGGRRGCGIGASYDCYEISFRPKVSAFHDIRPGTTVKLEIIHRQNRSAQTGSTFLNITRPSEVNFNWQTGSNGEIFNGPADNERFANQNADLTAYIGQDSEMGFELWVKEGTDAIEKFTLTKGNYFAVPWAGQEWYYRSSFGDWYVRSFSNCPSARDGLKCSEVRFIPNRSAVNNLSAKDVTMWLRANRMYGGQAETYIQKLDIYGRAISSVEWDNEGSGTITTGNLLEFNDITGTTSIYKRKVSTASVSAIEQPNDSTRTFDETTGAAKTINNFRAVPLGENFKYGTWYVEENFNATNEPADKLFHTGGRRFIFKPNSAAIINPANTDENVTSTLQFHIHQGDGSTSKIHTATITVTIDRSSIKPILTISSKTSSVVEGNTAVFTITSHYNPGTPFRVGFIPSNTSGNFLDFATFPSGIPQFETLTFSQKEGSDAWTDEIEINLRDSDGVNAEDGSITVTLDTISEDTFYLTAPEPNNAATIIVEDAEKPTLSFADSPVSVIEEDVDKNIQVTLNLSEAIDDSVTVSYSIVDETATAVDDYVDITNGSVTVLPNTTSIPINIKIKGDNLSEGNETFKVIISEPPTNAYFALGTTKLETTVTILDDEPILVSVTTRNFTVAENVVNGEFVINLGLSSTADNTHSANSRVFYSFSVTNRTAIKGTDFLDPISTGVFEGDSTTSTIKIPIINDVENEGNETFRVSIFRIRGGVFAGGGGWSRNFDVTIIDNEKPILTFAQSSVSVVEEDQDKNVYINLNLTGTINSPMVVFFDTIAETATANVDYIDVPNGLITFRANSTSVGIRLRIKGDNAMEGNETFKVRIATPPDTAVFADGVSELLGTITITDDEMPTLSVANSTLMVSESSGTTQIGLNLSGPTSNAVAVTYSTSISDTNTASQIDFTAQSESTTTILASSTTGLISIPIINDSETEVDETFTLTLSQVTGAQFLGGQNIEVQVTIVDDEGLPTLSIDSTAVSANEQNGYAEIGLSLTSATTEPVIVTYTATQNTAIEGEDYMVQASELIEISTNSTAGNIYIPISNDNVYEGNEDFTVKITGVTGAAYDSEVINTDIIVTIVDNEAEPTLAFSAYSCDYAEPISAGVFVGESDELILNAKLSRPSKFPVTFNYTTTTDSTLNFFANSNDLNVENATQYQVHPGSICTEIKTSITQDEFGEEDEVFWAEFTDDSGTNLIPRFQSDYIR